MNQGRRSGAVGGVAPTYGSRANCAIIPVPPGSATPALFSRICPCCAGFRPHDAAPRFRVLSRMPVATPTQDIAVRLSDVRLDRGTRTVLSGIDLEVPRGSITAVLGPSGSGKSTLLAALTGELLPAAGTVEVLGQPVPRRQRALLELRKGIGVLLQGNGLLTDLTAAENVALPLRTHTKLPRPVIDRLVAMKLHAVGLRTAGDLYPRELSGGMARRVEIGRAHVCTPVPNAHTECRLPLHQKLI